MKTLSLPVRIKHRLLALGYATATLGLGLLASGFSQSATAQTTTVIAPAESPAGVLSLDASASDEIPQDVISITLFFEQEAAEPAGLTTLLNQKARQAMQVAQGHNNVEVRSGVFSVTPATDRDGHISAWRGRTEIILKSSDVAAATALAGQLSATLSIGEVEFSLSPQAQQAAVDRLTAQAIKAFRQRADAAANAFGYGGYAVREVNLTGTNAVSRPMPMRMMAAAAPLAAAGGRASVSVSVSGSVQMTR